MNFEYTNEDLILQSSSSLSKFDKTMESLWTVSYEGNYFRYKIDLSMSSLQKVSKRNVDIFILPNCNRFNHRRKPQPFSDINDPITPESFNFNKVPTREILLNVFEKHNTKSSFILINVSPFSYLHSLFVPEMKECYNQVLRKQSLYSAVKCFLLSANSHLWMLVMSCQQLRIAHNVFIARSKSSGYMRVVVWPRCSAFGAKNVSAVDSEVGFYVAVAELAGMLVVASEDIASTLNYDKVESILSNERLPENTLHILQCTLFEALRTT
ncbi:unnamed protein product [Heterobilharzia americana]|nr:unnamed protein product [Heterobilharzia americana]